MINKIKIKIPVLLFACLLLGDTASAAVDATKFYSPTAIVHEALLLCAIICLAWSAKVLSLVRGGLMSKSWQMFVLGFCFLVGAQLMVIVEQAQLVIIPGYFVSAIYLLMSITWLFGLYQLRKVLG
ncbi:MAG: hypothetical protein ABIJ45_12375 [Candidatus Zixiibacteriota bacterium]